MCGRFFYIVHAFPEKIKLGPTFTHFYNASKKLPSLISTLDNAFVIQGQGTKGFIKLVDRSYATIMPSKI